MRKALRYGMAATILSLLLALFLGAARAAAGENPKPVTVIRFFSSPGQAFAYEFAAALGYLKTYHIEIKSMGFSQGGPENVIGVTTGEADIAGIATPGLINAIVGGAPILGLIPDPGEGQTSNSKFFVLADSSIKTAHDLKGKTIAVNTLGAHLDFTVRQYLKQHGMSPSDVQLVVVPGPQLDQVLQHKQVDVVAVGAWEAPFAGRIEAEGGVRVLFTDYDVLGPMVVGSDVMKKSFIEQHPQVVRELVTASAKAVDWADSHLEQARRVLAESSKSAAIIQT